MLAGLPVAEAHAALCAVAGACPAELVVEGVEAVVPVVVAGNGEHMPAGGRQAPGIADRRPARQSQA